MFANLPILDTLAILKWPLLASLILPWLLIYLGLHIIERQVIFVDLALAQMAALGSCVGTLAGYDEHDFPNFLFSMAFTIVGAALLTLTRTRRRHVPQEALIGIVYVVTAAACILVLNFTAEGREALQRSLVGELLVVPPHEIFKTFGLYLIIGSVHYIFRKKFLTITFEPEKAAERRISQKWWDFLFYVLFGMVITSFVHIGGVLLVFSYLIIPGVCAGFLVSSLKARLILGWMLATLASAISISACAPMDLPVGPAIVCGLGITLILCAIAARFRTMKNDSLDQHAKP